MHFMRMKKALVTPQLKNCLLSAALFDLTFLFVVEFVRVFKNLPTAHENLRHQIPQKHQLQHNRQHISYNINRISNNNSNKNNVNNNNNTKNDNSNNNSKDNIDSQNLSKLNDINKSVKSRPLNTHVTTINESNKQRIGTDV